MKKKADKTKLKIVILSIILGLSLVAMIGLSAAYIVNLNNNRQGQAFYASLSVDVVPSFAPQPIIHETNTGVEELPRERIIDDPALPEPEPFVPAMDFDELRESIPDIVGWILSEGTPINYPLVQTDDNSFYLTHLPDKSQNNLGSVFLDYRNNADFSDTNIFIYGHNTTSGTMFGTLKNYTDQQYFDAHDVVQIFTPYNNFDVQLFAGYLLDSRYEHPPLGFVGETDFDEYIDDLKSRTFLQSDVQVSYGDTIVFLCTCQEGTRGEARSMRRVLVGKLVDMGD